MANLHSTNYSKYCGIAVPPIEMTVTLINQWCAHWKRYLQGVTITICYNNSYML